MSLHWAELDNCFQLPLGDKEDMYQHNHDITISRLPSQTENCNTCQDYSILKNNIPTNNIPTNTNKEKSIILEPYLSKNKPLYTLNNDINLLPLDIKLLKKQKLRRYPIISNKIQKKPEEQYWTFILYIFIFIFIYMSQRKTTPFIY